MEARTLDGYHFLQLNEELLKNPHPFFDALRKQAPVYREPDYGVYVVSRYDDVVEVDRQADVFSHIDVGLAPYRALPAEVDALPRWRDSQPFVDRVMANDPPDHTRHRGVLNRLLKAARIAALEPRIRDIANELIDTFIDDGRVEYVQRFSNILPTLAVNELMGVSRAHADMLKTGMRRRGTRLRHESENPREEFLRSLPLRSVYEEDAPDPVTLDYFTNALLERRQAPRDDLMSEFANARFADGEDVPLNTLVMMVLLLYRTGAADDTIQLLNGVVLAMLRDGAIEPQLRADPTLIEPFIEEVLRYEASLIGLFRIALRDTSVGGVAIRKGDVVMVLYGAANRDEACFQHHDAFDLRRYRATAKRHLTFGYGPHFCAGAPLARLQAKVATQELLRRMTNIRFPEGMTSVPYAPSILVRVAARLDIAFDRAGDMTSGFAHSG